MPTVFSYSAILASLICSVAAAADVRPQDVEGRYRVCVITDLGGDPDDEQSLLRFVALANMYDVEGIVLSPFLANQRRPDCTPFHARDHVNYVLDQYIRDHGPLGVVGPAVTDDDITEHPIYPYVKPPQSDETYAMKEGDTPSFLGLVANGLSFPDDPRADDWSGQYEQAEGKLWDDLDRVQDRRQAIRGIDSIAKWRPHFNADFQARMDWMSQDDVTRVNHHPVAAIGGRSHPNNAPERIGIAGYVAGGRAVVHLSAVGSKDPDGNSLRYHWRQDAFPGDRTTDVKISPADARTTDVSFECEPGRTIHVILTITDDGTPRLHAYRRAIICLPR